MARRRYRVVTMGQYASFRTCTAYVRNVRNGRTDGHNGLMALCRADHVTRRCCRRTHAAWPLDVKDAIDVIGVDAQAAMTLDN